MGEIRPEARAAARWWASQLTGKPVHRIAPPESPDASRADFANIATAVAGRTYTAEQVEAFRVALERRIEEFLADQCWYPDDPKRGSYFRVVECGYGPDRVLTQAAEDAGITVTILELPMKTIMWVNPGEVAVSAGYCAPIVDVPI